MDLSVATDDELIELLKTKDEKSLAWLNMNMMRRSTGTGSDSDGGSILSFDSPPQSHCSQSTSDSHSQ